MFTKPYANILGPSMRYIFDFSTPDLFYIVLPSGESGNFMSKHYKEMIPDWLKGNYYKVRTDFTRRSRRENKLLTLKPAA
jgi:penicillin amidase